MLTDIIGWSAATIGVFVALPQLYKVYTTKSAKDLSRGMWLALTVAQALWMTYGILEEDPIIIAPNFIALATNVIIVLLKYQYDRANK